MRFRRMQKPNHVPLPVPWITGAYLHVAVQSHEPDFFFLLHLRMRIRVSPIRGRLSREYPNCPFDLQHSSYTNTCRKK